MPPFQLQIRDGIVEELRKRLPGCTITVMDRIADIPNEFLTITGLHRLSTRAGKKLSRLDVHVGITSENLIVCRGRCHERISVTLLAPDCLERLVDAVIKTATLNERPNKVSGICSKC